MLNRTTEYKGCWFFLFCLLAVSSYGQNRSTTAALLREARKEMPHSFASAYTLASRTQSLAMQLRDTAAYIESACLMSEVLANSSKARPALKELNRTWPVSESRHAYTAGVLSSAKAYCYYTMGIYDSARFASQKAIVLYKSVNAATELATEYSRLAETLVKTGETEAAIELNDKARRLLKSDDFNGQGRCFDVLAAIYLSQHQYDKAIDACNNSYRLFRMGHYTGGMGSSCLHRGNAYYMKIADDSAKKYYSLALSLFTRQNDTAGVAICYSNISRIFLEAGNSAAAIDYANKALNTVKNGDYTIIKASTLQHLGDIYTSMGKHAAAIDQVNKALLLARSHNQKVVERDCHKSLSEIYFSTKQPAKAYEHLLAAYRLKDSLQPVLLNRKLAEMQARYESEKKESEIRLLQQRNYINRLEIGEQEDKIRVKNAIIGLSLLLSFFIILVFYFRRQKQRLNERMEREQAIRQSEENERMRIAKDIHDEFGSGLSKIKLLSEMATKRASGQEQLRSSLEAISETSRGLVDNMRDLIWASDPENTTLDSLAARLREYAYDYLDQFPIEFSIDFPEQIAAKKISRELSRNVFMILKESLQNIIKHANATQVQIRLTIGDQFQLEIIDNGKGFDVQAGKNGHGLNNIQARSQSLEGSLHLDAAPGKGTRVLLLVALS